MAVKGVDISEFNGSVDFTALKNAGVKYAIIRTGFGIDYPGQQDKRFAENVKKADAAVSAGAADQAEAIRVAIKKVDQAAAKKLMHKNAAAHKKSALMKKLAAASK